MKKKEKQPVLGIIFILALLLGSLLLTFGKERIAALSVGKFCVLDFSEDSGFYDTSITLKVSSHKPGEIYYTLDGSEPDKTDERTMHYTKPIEMECGVEERVWNLKFREYVCDGTKTDVYTKTYVIGKNVKKRYNTLVMNIATDNDNLYGYENGIFVEGKLREEYLKAHPGVEEHGDMPANYNVHGRESEREAHVDIFEADGTSVVSQNVGIRTSGGVTRQASQKSFKLYARDDYDTIDYFPYAFFEDASKEQDGSLNAAYECIKVRNTGNDRMAAFIRDELGMRLVKQAGIQDTQAVRPVAVYINATYAGLYWIHETYDDSYFRQKYGNYDGEMVTIGNKETNMDTETDEELENQYAKEYNALYAKYSRCDLTNDANYEKLCEQVDVDNYIQYFVAECCLGNLDWPGNNERIYRYVKVGTEEYKSDSVFDGRYRYLIYDVDSSMGYDRDLSTIAEFDLYKRMNQIIENDAPLMRALLKRPDVKRKFVRYICDLANESFSYENVTEVLEDMEQERKREMQHFIKVSNLDDADSVKNIDEAYMEEQLQVIHAWSDGWATNMIDQVERDWDVGEKYKLHLSIPEDCYVQMNTAMIETPGVCATYFTGTDVSLTANVPKGKKVAYWRINGEKYYGTTLRMKEERIKDGHVYITLYTRDDTMEGLILTKVHAQGEDDYFYIANPTQHRICTNDYYVKDREKASHVYYLPERVMSPGEELRINCQNCLTEDRELLMQVGFSLKSGETLTLENRVEDIRCKVTIPTMGKVDSIYQWDNKQKSWMEK